MPELLHHLQISILNERFLDFFFKGHLGHTRLPPAVSGTALTWLLKSWVTYYCGQECPFGELHVHWVYALRFQVPEEHDLAHRISIVNSWERVDFNVTNLQCKLK